MTEIEQNLQTVSICTQLNLKIEDLNIEELLEKPIYRRLYNIVLHDRNKTEYAYRKNLIKELYFLLKITPVMKSELQDIYLHKLQKLYNLNDHKKTELASGGLKNLVEEYFNGKEQQSEQYGQKNIRPQSGVNWNKNISPFLRPYTAQRASTRPNRYRPDSHKSSKFGKSTAAQTNLQNLQELTIRDFNLTIEEEFQVSQDFFNKNRTIHPESQPIYEQLFNIIQKATGRSFSKHSKQYKDSRFGSQNQIIFQKDKQQFFSGRHQGKQESKKKDNQENGSNMEGSLEKNDQQIQQFDKVSQQSEKQNSSTSSQKSLQDVIEKKIFVRDQNISHSKKKLQQFQFFKPQNQKDALYLKRMNNKYFHLTNNKFVNSSKDDQQLVHHYVNYTRAKSALKRQFNRKSETKRLLSAKSRSQSNLQNLKSPNQRIYSAHPRKSVETLKTVEGIKQNNFFDFTEDKENEKKFVSSTTYNKNIELERVYRRPIQQYKKLSKTNHTLSSEIKPSRDNLTKFDRFLSIQRLNPIADIHLQKFNQQALSQIQKIKQKCGGNKKWVGTEALMKALYIDSYDNKDTNEWKGKDPYFNMVSDGSKKLKKKVRKLKKAIVRA